MSRLEETLDRLRGEESKADQTEHQANKDAAWSVQAADGKKKLQMAKAVLESQNRLKCRNCLRYPCESRIRKYCLMGNLSRFYFKDPGEYRKCLTLALKIIEIYNSEHQ